MSDERLAALDRAGPVLIALVAAVMSVVYVATAYIDSSRIHNVIFIIPMAAIVVVLAGIVVARVALTRRTPRDASSEGESAAAAADGETASVGPLGIAALMALLLAYAFSIPWIGFDVASLAFMAAGLWILGERRPLVVATLSLVFGLGVTWLLLNGARVPAHTLLF